MNNKQLLLCSAILTTSFTGHAFTSRHCDFTISSVPVVINSPGRWCLKHDIDSTKLKQDAINIQAEHVILDGRGFKLKGPTDAATAIRGVIVYDKYDVTIQSITLTGFNRGIVISDDLSKAAHISINNVIIDNVTQQGIYIRANNFIIKKSHILGIGPSSLVPHAFATGIYAEGNSCKIESNEIRLGKATGNGENVGIGLYYGQNCSINNNRIYFDHFPEWGRNFGIWSKPVKYSTLMIKNNRIQGAHYAMGPWGKFKDNTAINLLCKLFVERKGSENQYVDLRGNVVLNQALGSRKMKKQYNCPDNTSYAEARYFTKPSALSSYATAMAWGEGGADTLVETFAWLTVAAHYQHEVAVNIVSHPEKYGYSPEIVSESNKLAQRIIQSGKIPSVSLRK